MTVLITQMDYFSTNLSVVESVAQENLVFVKKNGKEWEIEEVVNLYVM